MDFKEKSKRCLKIIVTAFLAFSMVLTTGMSEVFATNQITPDYNEDIKLSMKWQLDKNKQADNLDIHATNSSSRRITQRISYSGENVSRDYMPGELSIVVKGMKMLYRNQNLKAEQIGADLSSDTNKLRDWSYSYNNASDEYTFTNNHQISKDTTLDGFFDIIYNVDPSSSMHGLKLEGKDALYSMLYYPDGSCNKSNSITLSNQTDKSEYQVNIKQGTTTSDSGLNGYVKDKTQYVLLRYDLSQDVHYVARDLATQEQILTLPDGFIVCNNDVNATKVKDDTNSYKVNLYQKGYVYVACPNKYLGQTVNVKFDLNGIYFEDDKDAPYTIASSNINTTLPHKYTYTTPDGGVYRLDVDTSGNNLISSDIQSSRGQNTSYDVKTTYSYIQDYNAELETVVDHNFITVKDGQYRQMKESEYDITSISTGNTFNDASQQISTGSYEIYACKSSVFKKEGQPIRTGSMSDLKNLFLELPNGTKSVGIIYRDFHEAFSSDIKVNMNIHDVGDDTLFNSGRVIHSAYTRFHTYDEKWSNPKDLTAKTYKDVPGVNEEEIDKTSYGNVPLTRDADDDNITAAYIDRNNYMSTTVHFDNLKEESVNNVTADGQLYASFDFKDDTSQPTDFSLYTILPKGVHLKDASDVNELFDSVSINGSSTNVSNSYLTQHCTPVMIDNYKNSGRTYLAFKFKLNKGDMNASSSLTVNMKLIVDLENVDNGGYSDSLQSYLSYDDSSVPLYKFNLHKDDGRSYGGSIYTDVNRNGSTDDLVATDEDTASFTYASSGQYGIKKYIKGSKDSHYTSDPTFTEIGKVYKYALEISTGTSTLKDITLHEDLEKLGDVQGQFKSISFSKGYTGKYDEENHTITLNEPISEGQKVRAYITLEMPNTSSLVGHHIKNNFTLEATVMSNGVITKHETGLESNTTEAVVSLHKGTVAVRKLDAKTKEPLSGAKFSIYENEYSDDPIETKVSNANGYANFKNLDCGKSYYVKEIEAPKGYKKASSGISTTLDKERVEVAMTNQPIPGTIQVTKRSDLDKDAKLKGAKFTLYRVVDDEKQVVSSEVTNNEGSITFDNLEWGKYVLEETEAPKGYSISSEPQEIVVDANTVVDSKNNPTTIKVDVENKQDDVLVTLNKFVKDVNGKETDERLQGAKFKLYKVKNETNYSLSESNLKGEYYTNENGQILVDKLAYGTYVFHEAIFPVGYESDSSTDDYVFVLSPESKKPTVKAYNKRKPGTIAIKKSDGHGHVVTGAKFTLYDENMNPLFKDVEVNDKGTLAFENIEWGTYHIKETTAPLGYSPDPNVYDVTIKATQLFQRFEIANNEILGNVKLKKIDSDSKKPLQNAEFNLCKDDGSVVKTLTTDANGEALYEGLSWGTYYLEETKAPEGYTIDTTKHRFAVNAYTAGKTQTLVIKNTINTNKSFKLIKRIKKDDIWKPHGQVVFNYNVSYVDNTGTTIYRNVSLNFGKYKTETIAGTQYAVVSTVIDKIPSNVTEVKVYEYGTNRYELVNVTDQNGTTLNPVKNSDNLYSSYILSLTDNPTITFKNDKVNWKDYSDSGSIINSISKKVWLTSITAINNDKEVKPRSEVNMTVLANYTDGTHKELSSNEYTITKYVGISKEDGKFYWPNKAGTYVIEVEYEGYKDTIIGTIDKKDLIDDPYLVHDVKTILGYGDGKTGTNYQAISKIVFCTDKAPKDKYTKIVNAQQIGDDNSVENLKDGIVSWCNGGILYFSTQDPTKHIKLPKNSSNQFRDMNNLAEIQGMEMLDTSYVTDMSGMFCSCRSLKTIELSCFDTADVTDMSNLFKECTEMEYLDISKWNTSLVRDMSSMFYYTSFTTIDISQWDLSNVIDLSSMFENSRVKSLDVSNWNVSNVKSTKKMFECCTNLETLDVSKWDTSSLEDMSYMFSCDYYDEFMMLRELDVSNWDTSNVSNMVYTFQGCGQLNKLDVSKWNTANVVNMEGLFYDCRNLDSIDVSKWNTSNVINMSMTFYRCGIDKLDISEWDTSNVTSMAGMFAGSDQLSAVVISKWNVSKVKTMREMFSYCRNLRELDLSNWNTSNLESMWRMFRDCDSLRSLNIANLNVSKVTDMSEMFSGCKNLKALDIKNWDVSSVVDMSNMFGYYCGITDIDLSNWNVSNLKYMNYMFHSKTLKTIDLSGWDTSKVSYMDDLFYGCYALKTIYVSSSWDVSNLRNSYEMFKDCYSLVGQNGTTYNSSRIDQSMANYAYGYLTYKPGKTLLPITLDYCDGKHIEKKDGISHISQLPIPEREGYKFDGWYYKCDKDILATHESIDEFSNLDSGSNWYKDPNGVWCSNVISWYNQTAVISQPFTLNEHGMITFEWAQNNKRNPYSCYLVYNIYNVNTGTYLTGSKHLDYKVGLGSLYDKSTNEFSKVKRELDAGTYQLTFMIKSDDSGTNEVQGFVKNIVYGEEFTYSNYLYPVGINEIIPDGVTLYAKWIKQ